MPSIFLSYAREDHACAEKIATILEARGHEVWWDRRLDSGEEFGVEIEAALGEADVVLVVWSADSVKSRWVRDEAAAGGDTGRLVPVSIDGSQPPMGFRQFHTLDLTDWKGGKRDKRTVELLRSVERRLNDKLTPSLPQAPKTRRRFPYPTGKTLWAMVAALALAMTAGTFVFLNGRAALRGPAPNPTIGLLPFTTASVDPQLHDLAAQARDSVAHTLPQIGIPVRMLNVLPQDRGSAADFVLSGELSRNGDKIVTNLRLAEAVHGVTVSTNRIEAAANEARDLPERVGAQMAGFFEGWTLLILDRRQPLQPALIAELLGASHDSLLHYQMMKRVAAQYPDIGATQIALAFETGLNLDQIPRDERLGAVADGRRAEDHALALVPDFGNTYATWCLLHSETRMAECEDQLRKGDRVDPDATYIKQFMGSALLNGGRFSEAAEVTRLTYSHDPYHPVKIGMMLRMLEFAGDRDEVRDLYGKAVRWWPENQRWYTRNRFVGLLERGDFQALGQLKQEVGADALPPAFRESAAIAAAVKAKSASALHAACIGDASELPCMIALATIGDLDAAYTIAHKIYPTRVGRNSEQTEQMWLDDPSGNGPLEFITSPAAAPMRRDPRYLQLAERTGLLGYWRGGRTPDFCRKSPEPICGQLLKRS